jgi:AcrR family transcriptional regulator
MEISSTEDRIIEGASELFFSFGYSKVTMEEIGEKVGCAKKTVYNHFPTKLDLLQAVINTTIYGLINDLETIADDPKLDFLEKLVSMLKYLFIQLTTYKRNLIEEFSKYTSQLDDDTLPDLREKLVPRIQQLVDEGVAQGLIKDNVSREFLPYTYLSLVWGEVFLYRRFSLPINPGELLIQSIQHTLGGILTRQGVETLLQKGDAFENR